MPSSTLDRLYGRNRLSTIPGRVITAPSASMSGRSEPIRISPTSGTDIGILHIRAIARVELRLKSTCVGASKGLSLLAVEYRESKGWNLCDRLLYHLCSLNHKLPIKE